MAVFFMISLPKIPYVHRMYVVLANPTYMTVYLVISLPNIIPYIHCVYMVLAHPSDKLHRAIHTAKLLLGHHPLGEFIHLVNPLGESIHLVNPLGVPLGESIHLVNSFGEFIHLVNPSTW
jgi:hypothetical protein